MCSYLWNFRVKCSENFVCEICTKFTENLENILGKLRGRFSKSLRKFCEKLTKFWVLSSKYLKNLLEIFDKFSVVQVFIFYNYEGNLKKILQGNLKMICRKFRNNSRKF